MQAKWIQRFRILALHAGWMLLPSIANIAAAWWVVTESSEAVWGAFVDPMLFAAISIHILSWGNKEFLLRAFALRPDAIGTLWKQALVSRGALLFIVLPALFLTQWDISTVGMLMAWVMAGYIRHSFDVVVLYQRNFGTALLVELGATAILATGLFIYRNELAVESLVMVFTGSQIFRALAFMLIYGKAFLFGPYPQIQFRYFNAALPFFLLGFVGMLSTRTDLICVSFWMEDEMVGRYQVLINFLIYLQVGAGLLLYPYAKNIYRLPDRSLFKLARRMVLPGTGATLLGVPLVMFGLDWFFGIDLELKFWLAATFFVIPIYLYSTYVYLLFKHKAQQQVLLANAGAAVLNLGLNILLIPDFGIWGALLGSAAAQWFTLLMLVLYARRFKPQTGT